ncbi:MAG: penicillin-binding protein activator LpoB [Filimonas sp.]|nr:penicillin-binding protein activator LpoB [Filimonas sp.]
MTKKWIAIIAIGTAVVTMNACSPHKVTRISPSDEVDISGRWNNTDSKLVSQEMVSSVLQGTWLSDHLQKKGKKPVVIVGMVENKSHEHIDAETFIKDVERSFVSTQKVGLVQGGKKREELRGERADQQTNASASSMKKFGLENGADYILQGSINSIVDSYKKDKVVYYQVDLQLTNMETNEVVWIGDKKIAKQVRN